LLTDLLVKKRKQTRNFLAAVEVESGWDDGQVLGLILASLLWGPDTILGARQIAQDYKNELDGGLRGVLVSLLQTLEFTAEMAEWLANSLGRLNRSHGFLLEHYRGANVATETYYFELAFFGKFEEDRDHFKTVARKVNGSSFEKAMVTSARLFPNQPQWSMVQLRPFVHSLLAPAKQAAI